MPETESSSMAEILADFVPRAEYEAALAAIEEAVGERDDHRKQLEELTPRAKELEGKLRGRTYRDAFERVRKELKVRDEFAGDAFDLLKLPMDADEPDEKAMRRSLEDFLKDRGHYVAKEREARRELPAGEGHSRGGSVRPGEPEMRVTRQQLGNALWMRENQGKMLEAKRAGALVIDED